MPTAIDVFAKVRGHERSERLAPHARRTCCPTFAASRPPARGRDGGLRADHARLERLPRADGDPRVREAARAALDRYGTGLTGSRLLNGTLDLHLDLERELAEWMGTEEAIVFTTGHQANVGTLGTILAPGAP